MSEFQLYADEFCEADQVDLVGFSCGDTKHGRYCTEWILGPDSMESIANYGTKVWLFRNATGQVVGYGSVGTVRWRWPLPDGSYTSLLYIPMLGIDQRFQGQPPDAQWRYSRQIMNHLISEANGLNRKREKPAEYLLLLVDRTNEAAVKLYARFDFELIPVVTRGPGLRVMKHRLRQ
ncbi:GNAT family N-acetyltransferase [Rhodopirellula sp. P2]|uniref:GNAT family N-acetyltransferase n=1 Tax=Rhodopirellula sp. P2 TaxID=2127060 RepID=UPI0023674FE3|nr:N-acetyltransferase [Rhodopirellula sp. P2]WDQ17447.1 N-acetyltransferase [Rhodopirellula sp. P2]